MDWETALVILVVLILVAAWGAYWALTHKEEAARYETIIQADRDKFKTALSGAVGKTKDVTARIEEAIKKAEK